MSDIRFVDVSVEMQFEQCDEENSSFEKEFLTLTHDEDDAIGQWLRTMRSRGSRRRTYRPMDRWVVGDTSRRLPTCGVNT